MSSAARDPDDAGRLTLALLLALGLHAALLLGIPADRWSIRLAEPSRFEVVVLSPPRARSPEPPAVEPEPATPEPMPGPPAAVSEPALPAPQSVPAPPPAPPTVLPSAPAPPSEPPASSRPAAPPPSAPPVKPAPQPPTPAAKPVPKSVPTAAKPAPKPPAPPTKPSTPTKPAPAPRVAIAPVAPPKPAKPPATPEAASPTQATIRPREPAPRRPQPDFSATAKPPPEPNAAESTRATRRPERGTGERASAGAGGRGRPDSGALLGQIAGLEAETQRRANAGVRGKRVRPSDTQSPEGFYIAAWIRKVERIGEMNFPDIARKLNASAGPVLDVAIRADGSLQDIRIVRSSGHLELDRAAQNIVRLGAPYAPFPPQLRQQYDVLYIARPWRFEPSGRWQAR